MRQSWWGFRQVVSGACVVAMLAGAPVWAEDGDEEDDRAGLGAVLLERQGRILIHGVYEDGPADEAGLRRGDEIRRVDGERIRSVRDVVSIIRDKDPDDELEIEIRRHGESKTVDVELGRAREVARYRFDRERDRRFAARPDERDTDRQLQMLQRQVQQLQREVQQLRQQVGPQREFMERRDHRFDQQRDQRFDQQRQFDQRYDQQRFDQQRRFDQPRYDQYRGQQFQQDYRN